MFVFFRLKRRQERRTKKFSAINRAVSLNALLMKVSLTKKALYPYFVCVCASTIHLD